MLSNSVGDLASERVDPEVVEATIANSDPKSARGEVMYVLLHLLKPVREAVKAQGGL